MDDAITWFFGLVGTFIVMPVLLTLIVLLVGTTIRDMFEEKGRGP